MYYVIVITNDSGYGERVVCLFHACFLFDIGTLQLGRGMRPSSLRKIAGVARGMKKVGQH